MSLDDHSHCVKCSRVKCMEGCPMITCEHGCDAIFHWCKKDEHLPVCFRAKVPCINRNYGCPREMPRSELSEHLRICPASVVCCPCEWNRWPVYAKERLEAVPIQRTNHHAKSGQLDVALALRDQRLLADSMKLPRNLRRSLKDNLNHRSPAVPFIVSPNSQQISMKSSPPDEDVQENWHFDDGRDSVEKEPSSVENAGENHEVSTGLSDVKLEDGRNSNKDTKPAECNEADDGTATNESASKTRSNTCLSQIPHPPAPAFSLHQMMSLDLNIESITRYQAKPRSMYTFLCLQVFRRDQYPWHVKNVHAEIYSGLNGWLEQRCPMATYGCSHSVTRLCPNSLDSRVVYSPVLESFGVQPQYSSTSNGTQGMTYSKRVAFPTADVENSLESPKGNTQTKLSVSSDDQDYLSSMPVELLERIAGYLDGFSLNNLALTSAVLENVCFNILKRKGIVLVLWQKQKTEEKTKWTTDGLLWMFPNSVTPIKKWVMNDLFSMSHHLKNCPYNKPRELPEGRVRVMVPSDDITFQNQGPLNNINVIEGKA